MKNKKKLIIRVPATIANFGPGFDVLGASVNLYNEFSFVADEKFAVLVKNSRQIPTDKTNPVWRSFVFAWKKFSAKPINDRWQIVIADNIPLGSGLGSSATAHLAGVVAAASFCGISDEKTILKVAVEIEGHPDNVVPAYLGGLWAAYWDKKDLTYVRLADPGCWPVLIWYPERKVLTEKARKILPARYLRAEVIYNLSRLAFLAVALKDRDWALLKLALDDKIHQPYRKKFIPEFDIIRKIASEAGAWATIISGSGPSLAIFGPVKKIFRMEKSIRKKIGYGKFYRLKLEKEGLRKKWL